MDNLQFIISLIQEFDDLTRVKQTPSYAEKLLQNQFKHKIARPKYDHATWLTQLKLTQGTVCKVCGASHTLGHHVKPVDLFPELAEDVNNGLIVCLVCHQKVHAMLLAKGFVNRTDFDQVLSGVPLVVIDGYTVEELAEKSGYSIKTVYNLTAYGCLPSPSRGTDPTKYKSKGLYPKKALDKLFRFTELKNCGRHNKDRIILIMKNELQEEEAILCQ